MSSVLFIKIVIMTKGWQARGGFSWILKDMLTRLLLGGLGEEPITKQNGWPLFRISTFYTIWRSTGLWYLGTQGTSFTRWSRDILQALSSAAGYMGKPSFSCPAPLSFIISFGKITPLRIAWPMWEPPSHKDSTVRTEPSPPSILFLNEVLDAPFLNCF